MTTQAWINIVLFIGGGLMGAIMRATWQAIESQRVDLTALQRAIAAADAKNAETYVRRDDFREAVFEMKALLHEIRNDLRSKADK